MNLETWKNLYYPVPAKSVTTEKEAVKHSLRKWRGLTARVREEHDLDVFPNEEMLTHTDTEGNISGISISSSTCALCQFHMADAEPDCDQCVLTTVRGVCCTERNEEDRDLFRESPYFAYIKMHDPTAMIELLEEALHIV